MNALRRGQEGAAERLVELFYIDLRQIARNQMRVEAAGHTLQPTALVNEFYLELRRIRQLRSDPERHAADDRAAFLALAAFLMKRLLIHHARPMSKQIPRLSIDDAGQLPGPETSLHEIDMALAGLESVDPKLRRVVEMRVYEGRSIQETAEALGCTTRTVDRYWNVARVWLRDHFGISQSDI